MSRIDYHYFRQATHPCGRLVDLTPDYDSGEKVIHFIVPSRDQKDFINPYTGENVDGKDLVYGLEVDTLTGEVACGCPDFLYSRMSNRGRATYGVKLEHMAKRLKKPVTLFPLITRKPTGLCYHSNRVRCYLKRHEIYPELLKIEAYREQQLKELIEETRRKVA